MNLGQLLDRSFYLYRRHFALSWNLRTAYLAILAFQLTEVLVLLTEEGVGHN